jgi:hypothetical protein
MLKNLLSSQPTQAEIEYLDGFFVTLRYTGMQELERAMDTQKVARGGGIDVLDGVSKVMKVAMSRAIVSWRGLTKEVLLKMNLDLDLKALEDMDEELECTDEDKVLLLTKDSAFYAWVQRIAVDILALREHQAKEEIKN